MSRRKPRSRGVILGNRAQGPHRYRKETACEGGKAKAHRAVRQILKRTFRQEVDRGEHDA